MFDPYLSIEDISVVLERITLKVKQGEFVAIIGHSGCGKSTLLNVVAGLVPARSGGVVLENKEVNTPGSPLTDCAPLVIAFEKGYFRKYDLKVPQMVNHLRAKNIAGFCVGDPWNGYAVQRGLGRILITSYEIWNNHPEKVFGVTAEWAEQHPGTHKAVLMALLEAAQWLELPESRLEAAEIIARGSCVDPPLEVVTRSLSGSVQYAQMEAPLPLANFNVFYRHAASFPWRSHAVWFMSQMLRWEQLRDVPDIKATAERVYRTDLYREAASALGIPCPIEDYKTEDSHRANYTLFEGAHAMRMGADWFLDGSDFDPDRCRNIWPNSKHGRWKRLKPRPGSLYDNSPRSCATFLNGRNRI